VRVAVLGAGVVGTTCAWFLRDAGHEVSVFDRQPGVALETILANGGQLSVSHSEPWANPAAPRKLLKWLGRDDAPLLFRLQPELLQWLWGLAFLRECFPGRTARNVRRLVRLGLLSRSVLRQLREHLALEYDGLQRGILHLYTDERDFEASRHAAALMCELGCERRLLTPDEAVGLEPSLARFRSDIVGADYCAEDESGDAYRFTEQLARRCQAAGVRFSFSTTVTRLVAAGRRVTAVEVIGADGWPARHIVDAVVVALGIESRTLVAPLGLRLLIYPAKGYSATFDVTNSSRAPVVSLTDDQHKLVFSRLGNRLRVAGTAELSGGGRALNLARCEAITRRAQQMLPDACDYQNPRYWSGLRPLTPSNVPYLGTCRIHGLFLNTGHGTLGWTLAAASGQLVADLVSGRPTALPASELAV
jgi:D-amino-acid dehydrogenase